MFEFAPHELSHSAFWASVLDSLGSKDEELSTVRALGRSLLQSVGASPPEATTEVRTEYGLPEDAGRVDIYAKIDDREALLIENKVSDRPSVEQLRAYSESPDAEEAHFLLISTTYPTQNATKVEAEEPWTFLKAEDVLDLLDDVDGTHPILADYHRWLTNEVSQRRTRERQALGSDPDLRSEALGTVPGQWAFMKEVTEPFVETGRQYAHRSTTSGDPWTEFRFVEELNGGQDAVFYRVEHLSSGPVFRVHQFQKEPTPDEDSKKERLQVLREDWFDIVENAGELPWREGSNRGTLRCEIARVDLREHEASEIKAELERVYFLFVERLRDSGLDVEPILPE